MNEPWGPLLALNLCEKLQNMWATCNLLQRLQTSSDIIHFSMNHIMSLCPTTGILALEKRIGLYVLVYIVKWSKYLQTQENVFIRFLDESYNLLVIMTLHFKLSTSSDVSWWIPPCYSIHFKLGLRTEKGSPLAPTKASLWLRNRLKVWRFNDPRRFLESSFTREPVLMIFLDEPHTVVHSIQSMLPQ